MDQPVELPHRLYPVFVEGGGLVAVATTQGKSELFEMVAGIEQKFGPPVTHMVELPLPRQIEEALG